ncbi:MAG: C39 family peptidase [Verrucomicrobiae bacterium]|nr:C39 family peptidase [Verrucomicrobiae bacterium]
MASTAAAATNPFEIKPSLLDAETFWKVGPDEFLAQNAPVIFKQDSATGDEKVLRNFREFSFAGFEVIETLVSFHAGKPRLVTLNFYNRGDVGEQPAAKVRERAAELRGKITSVLGQEPRPHEERVSAVVVKKFQRWVAGETVFDLNVSVPDYIILEIKPKKGHVLDLMEQAKANALKPPPLTQVQLAQKVVRKDGEVSLPGIPMVDQGPKGYCALAVMQRIGEYYALDVDQHMMARLAGTGTGEQEGTTFEGMERAIKRICSGNSVNLVRLWDRWSDLSKNGYHRPAPEDYKSSRSEQQKLLMRVKQHIDQGTPLIWGVELAAAGETGTLGESGHLRLIIGYHEGKKEILYSDTWGPGHEQKRMSLENAATMTTMLYIVKPQRAQ